tara:strand:- start:4684 stop:4809 length:126 start_codon:yes stop_codon:yes gene_type:complete
LPGKEEKEIEDILKDLETLQPGTKRMLPKNKDKILKFFKED